MSKKLLLGALLSISMTLPAFGDNGDADRGHTLYEIYCTQCHGISGNGKGINIADMSVLPRDHTDKDEMSARTDEELKKAIKHGGKSVNKSVLMPSWEHNFSDEQINDIVAYLRKICCAN